MNNIKCGYCSSKNYSKLNTYKHYAIVCNDCNNVTHIKKDKYLIEYLFPRSIAKKILPSKAFLRLFSERNDFIPSEFYDDNAFDLMDRTEWRKSEIQQVFDQLEIVKFDPKGKRILDISGGPGEICRELKNLGAEVLVTEYAESQVDSMKNTLDIDAVKFDYLNDKINDVTSGPYDLIMVRSSIIFCPNLEHFVEDISNLITPDGIIMIESILPSYGEIFWWQQLEYKFPFIYSQETIEKCFLKNNLYLDYGYRDIGGYIGVKKRSYAELNKYLFTWLLEFPMLIFYVTLNFFKKPAIDTSFNHKMITQFWKVGSKKNRGYIDYKQGTLNKSKTFGYQYNGYLKKSKRVY